MEESLTQAVMELSGRTYLVIKADFMTERVRDLGTELMDEFFPALVSEPNIDLRLGFAREHQRTPQHKIAV
ncbi:MAG: hypothetical protein DRQ02_00815 [Candidatus Latescibacterota bacterium]|nr:MAG: hypothetical protein DRQ02_00815 [Candidatus Latescibacterota bacterium]RKY72799.1 MAG: hypothetical protein DRQ24_04215 [Candidatus Latescibacterota bacterium]